MEQQTQSKEVVFTYETLYEFLRREKARDELQKIEKTFYVDVLSYLKEKQQAYDESMSKNDIFSQGERDKLHIQIANIKKIVRDLYDIRERKIINMAVNHSRIKAHIADTVSLLPQEKNFFESLHSVMYQYRTGIVHKLMELRDPDVLPIILPLPGQNREEEKVAPPTPVPSQSKTKQVKFLDKTDQFFGEDLEAYGPYNANDQAELPSALAEILIQQGKAAEL